MAVTRHRMSCLVLGKMKAVIDFIGVASNLLFLFGLLNPMSLLFYV